MTRAFTLCALLFIVSACGSDEGVDLYRTVSPGAAHTCATTDDGQLLCWGRNLTYQLGVSTDGSPVSHPLFVQAGPFRPRQVESGGNISCALLPGQGALCWGGGTPHPFPVAPGFSFRDIGVNTGGCGVTTAGTVVCWTQPTFAPEEVPGISGATEVDVGPGLACATGPGIGIWCWTVPPMVPALVPGTTGLSYHGLTVGAGHACVLDAAGVARCWGTNSQGQTGVGHTGLVGTPTPVLWGDRPSNDDLFVQISAGNGITCGATESHGGFCWGEGVVYPASVAGDLSWDDIEAGGAHACGFTHGEHGLYCWGANEEGQLGTGKYISAPIPQKVIDP